MTLTSVSNRSLSGRLRHWWSSRHWDNRNCLRPVNTGALSTASVFSADDGLAPHPHQQPSTRRQSHTTSSNNRYHNRKKICILNLHTTTAEALYHAELDNLHHVDRRHHQLASNSPSRHPDTNVYLACIASPKEPSDPSIGE